MKKYLILSMLFFFISVIFCSTVNSKDHLYLLGKYIVIDPGHGYLDPGTIYEDIYEKDINLKISLYLKDILEKNGAVTIMTRDGDYDLSSPNALYRKKSDFDNRINLINNSGADIYISIHLNYLNDSNYFGPQVFYLNKNIYLASAVQETLNKGLNGSRKIKKIPSDIYMYTKLNIPGILIECGFLSNDDERNKLITNEYQQKVAFEIVNGIVNYYNS
ncbi:MAG: N-acetylmuramoyl-L-alanine amidase [Bacilli bacterium]